VFNDKTPTSPIRSNAVTDRQRDRQTTCSLSQCFLPQELQFIYVEVGISAQYIFYMSYWSGIVIWRPAYMQIYNLPTDVTVVHK